MATTQIPKITSTITADTSASGNTLVQRDSNGGINGNAVNATALDTSGTLTGTVVTETANFTAGAATDYLVDCTAGNVTVTLPSAASNAGILYTFTKKDSSGNTVTLTGVLGTATISTQYVRVKLICDGTSFYGA